MLGTNYLEFFKKSRSERFVILQGGRRSGKTFATFIYLQALCGLMQNNKVMVVCASYPSLQHTIEDFEKATGITVQGSVKKGHVAYSEGYTEWVFTSFDDYTKAQGTSCDFLFINEAVNISEDIADVLCMSVRKQIFLNFNPTKKSWVTKRMNDNNTICTTFRDNPHLTDMQKEEFESIRERAMKPNASVMDRYKYEVYYKGNFSEMVGSVFSSGILRITDTEYDSIPATECFGLDFGFATIGDPTTLIGVKIYNNCLYIKQYIYEMGLTSDEDLGHRIIECGLNHHTIISADYGGMGRSRIDNLITAKNGRWGTDSFPDTEELRGGFCVCNAIKGKILDGISQLLTYSDIYVTDSSTETISEMENYEIVSGGKTKGADHAIDAVRYAEAYARNTM